MLACLFLKQCNHVYSMVTLMHDCYFVHRYFTFICASCVHGVLLHFGYFVLNNVLFLDLN